MLPHPLSDSDRERLIRRYVAALDQGDARTIEAVLDAALYDSGLDHALAEVDAAYLEEAGLPSTDDSAVVAAMARLHLGGHAAEGPPPLEVRSVAARLLSKGRIPPGCRAVNNSLLTSEVPLIDLLDQAAVVNLLATLLGTSPPTAYAEAFRREATLLRMAHSDGPMRIAARTPRRTPR